MLDLLRLRKTQLFQLQRVVADEQRGRAHAARAALHLDLQAQAAVAAQQRRHAGAEGHQPAAAEAALPAFALFQQARVQADAGIDQEHPVVDQPHLHRLHRRVQQQLHGLRGVLRNAVRAAEVVEGALRQHAEGAAAAQHGLRHGVQRAVAAGGDDHAACRLGALHRIARDDRQAPRVVHLQQMQLAPGRGAGLFDRQALAFGIAGARAEIEDDEQRAGGLWSR